MSSRTTRSQARRALNDPDSASTAPPPTNTFLRPAKRAKTIKTAKKAIPAKNSRKQGRLSVLPTLPLDVLFEIFAHLGPADLLHLSRTTKAFRNILLTRQSAFLWKSVCDGVDELEKFPCPEDVSLPVWANLAYGGPWCDETGCSARANKVLWIFRRRLCKRCTGRVLVDHSRALEILGDACMWTDTVTELLDILPCDCTTRGHSNRLVLLYTVADVQNYSDEIGELLKTHQPKLKDPGDRSSFGKAMSELNERKKTAMAARTEHAAHCEDVEITRSDMRSNELWKMRMERFDDVKARLMAMGVAEQDAGSYEIREHKAVNKSQLLTDRVWTRISPILRAEAQRLRDERLVRERRDRLDIRQQVIRREYERRTLQNAVPSMLCYTPKITIICKLPRVASYLAADVELEEPTGPLATQAIRVILDDEVPGYINEWITRRQGALRHALPEMWPRAAFTDEEIAAHWPPPAEDATCNQHADIVDLDLAVYTFRCFAPSCSDDRVFYGLDILAHDCLNQDIITEYGFLVLDNAPIDYSVYAQPIPALHLAAMRVVELLGMDPTKTRPVDLDKADRFFTAEPRRPGSHGQPFMTWRQAVAYCADADTGAVWAQPAALRLATEREKVYVELRHGALHASLPLFTPDNDAAFWGCAHCSNFINEPGVSYLDWMYLEEVEEHLENAHDINPHDAHEGDDYFFNRTQDRDRHVDDGGAITYLEDGDDLEEKIAFYEAFAAAPPGLGFFLDEPMEFLDFNALPFPFNLNPGMILDDPGSENFLDEEF